MAADYGLSSFDYRNRFTVAHSYTFPLGRGQHFLAAAQGAEQAVLGGWQLLGILTLQSGAPLTFFLSTPTANSGTFTRPDRVCNGNLPASRQSINEWFDVTCLVDPPIYQFGSAARNVIIGPGLATYDVSLHKDFQLTEKVGLTFRAEFFNSLNRPNFGYPGNDIGSASAGTIRFSPHCSVQNDSKSLSVNND